MSNELTPEVIDRVKVFLGELNKLSRKYQIKIAGCGCCGSPFLDFSYDADDSYTVTFHRSGEIENLAARPPSEWPKHSNFLAADDRSEDERRLDRFACMHMQEPSE